MNFEQLSFKRAFKPHKTGEIFIRYRNHTLNLSNFTFSRETLGGIMKNDNEILLTNHPFY